MSKDGRFLRWFAAMGLALMAMLATAQVTTGSEQTEPTSPHVRVVSGPELPQRILLIPVDDRPAVTQFPQMIGAMAGATIETPPRELIGRFTQPGKPEAIMAWMASQNLKDYDAVVVSMDMIAYGGLIASRVERTSYNLAIQRIRQFWALRRTAPQTKFYGFGAIMRVAPTGTRENRDWRDILAKYAEEKADYGSQPTAAQRNRLQDLARRVPAADLASYERARDRNFRVNQELIRMRQQNAFTFLLLGEDDSKPTGPQKIERLRYADMAKNLNLKEDQMTMAAGIDQVANLLVSRAMSDSVAWAPRVRVVYADEDGRRTIGNYESLPIEDSLQSQLRASGATVAGPNEDFDYSLYVNTPDPDQYSLDAFLGSLESEVDQGFPVAVADTNLGKGGVGDPRLFDVLTKEGRSARLLAYAGWNTAGNTMGTTIPAANIYLLARRQRVEPLVREIGLRTFVLHRLVNDFEYHNFVRPVAYAMIDAFPNASREETYGDEFDQVNATVQQDLGKRLDARFKNQMLGTRFFAGNQQYEVVALEDVEISLPWPRAYEVQLDFRLIVRPVAQP